MAGSDTLAGDPPDVFVPVRPEQFAMVVRCVESVRAGLGPAARVCVVLAALPVNVRRTLDELGCDYLHEADALGFDAAALPGEPAARASLFAELLKWEVRRFSRTPTYLVVDPGRTGVVPAPWVDGRPALFCRNRFRFGCLTCFNYLFGLYPTPTAPAAGDVQHLDRAVVDEMVAKVEGRYGRRWAQVAVAIGQQVPGAAFDAGRVYGCYLNQYRPGTFAVVPLEADAGPTDAGVVRMGSLGVNGRFGNQVFQYAYLRSYADRHGLRAECPPWVGCGLFGHADPMGGGDLPVYREDSGEADEMVRLDPADRHGGVELWGYFQAEEYRPTDPAGFRRLFRPVPAVREPLDAAVDRLRGPGGTLVALHLRRGDYTGGPTFWPAPEAWYLDWLGRVWPTLVNPVLYVATDDPAAVLPRFVAYGPKTAADLGVTVNGAEFYPDFHVLCRADAVAVSNSSFSFAAAMLNETAAQFARPDPVARRLVGFDPWAAPVQLRRPAMAA